MGGDEREGWKEVRGGGRRRRRGKSRRKAASASLRSFILRFLANTAALQWAESVEPVHTSDG